MNLGFIGLGGMGRPMARNLLRAGLPLRVWNRTPDRAAELASLGAQVAGSVDALCADAQWIFLMLRDQRAVDEVLARHTPDFVRRVAGRTWVQLGTTSPGYSLGLAEDIAAAGGHYVEAPVSGSTQPAAQGRLVGMLAGDPELLDVAARLIAPLCRDVVRCGTIPNALRLKLAVNHYLIASVVALAETVRAGRAAGVDLDLLQEVIDAGPMASEVSRSKLEQLVSGDYSPRAAIRDVCTIAQLVREQAETSGVDAPLIRHCAELYRLAMARGGADLDMAAVIDGVARDE
jgi:3-hydroxyisobutyrate dehydrogenase